MNVVYEPRERAREYSALACNLYRGCTHEDYLRQFHLATRADFDKLLIKKLSEALNSEQKRNFVTNLLQEMRREGIVRPVGGKRGKGAKWELYKMDPKDLA